MTGVVAFAVRWRRGVGLFRGAVIFVVSAAALFLATQVLAYFIGAPIHEITSQSKSALKNIEPFALINRYIAIYSDLGSCSPVRQNEKYQTCLRLTETANKASVEARRDDQSAQLEAAELKTQCDAATKLLDECRLIRQGPNPFARRGDDPQPTPQLKAQMQARCDAEVSRSLDACRRIFAGQLPLPPKKCDDETKLGPSCTWVRQRYEELRDVGGGRGTFSLLIDIPYTLGMLVYELLSQPLLTLAVQALQLIGGFVLGVAFTYSMLIDIRGGLWFVALCVVFGMAGTVIAALFAMGILEIVAFVGWILSGLIPEHPEIFLDADGNLTFSVWGASLATIGQTSAVRAAEGSLHHRLASIFERFFG